MEMLIRPATAADVAAIQKIYAHHVLHGLGTFEEVPPDESEIASRMANVHSHGLPWLVAESRAGVAGYAYAGPFRLRSAYRFTVEDSVYVAPDLVGHGVGSRLLQSLIEHCQSLGLREILALIGDSENLGSINLHLKCDFIEQGKLTSVGLKFGRWVDVVLMQRSLTTTQTDI